MTLNIYVTMPSFCDNVITLVIFANHVNYNLSTVNSIQISDSRHNKYRKKPLIFKWNTITISGNNQIVIVSYDRVNI